jgi:hypothetical protein
MAIPVNPKPSQVRSQPPAIRVKRDGAEVCNLLTKEGRDEYQRRKRVMWERQGRMCCLYGFVEGCPGKLNWAEASFAHEVPRGHGSGSRDDRDEVPDPKTGRMKRQNGVAHWRCNSMQGSRRIAFNAAYNDQIKSPRL